MNPEERQAAHPINPHVARAETERMLQEAFTLPTSHVSAATIAERYPVRHMRGRRQTPVWRMILAAVGIAVAVDAALVMGVVAGFQVAVGSR